MCGIVGYLGESHSPKEVIINGLKKLEYRGYDSAGVAILDGSTVKRVRAMGKLRELEAKLTQEAFSGKIGIGHTRWATHGVPSERNAHPHQVDGISLVHNGIIENYLEIREELRATGANITSDTDSELVAHLLARAVKKTNNLLAAVQSIRARLRGAYSILVIWDKSPNEMVAFKDGPPLVIGLGEHETFVASDVQALLQYTKRFIYLDDLETAHIQTESVTCFDIQGKVIQKRVAEIDWSPDLVEKQGYAHFMLKEIYEQPRAVASAVAPHIDLEKNQVRLSRIGFSGALVHELEGLDVSKDWQTTLQTLKAVERVMFVACGTSYYAALVAKYLIEKIAKIPVETDVASEFRYREPVVAKNTLVITISQSGETADTLAALRLAKSQGAKILSICNVKNSSIDREAHGHIYMNSGPEIGVASTKAFVSTLAILNVLAMALARAHEKISAKEEEQMLLALLALPSQMEAVLAYDKYFNEASERLKKFKGFLYLGRGVNFPIALEGALKLKELAYMHAEGYAAGEMKHGPLALIDENMGIVVVAPQDDIYEKTMSNLEEARARGGKIIAIGTGDDSKLKGLSDFYLGLPQGTWVTNPILAVVPLQLMAYHLASNLGYDVDQPRNLAKSVTVE